MEHRFIGRNRELEDLRQLWKGGHHRIIGLYGLKSVGKTRLLKEFISELKEKNHDIKVVKFDFKDIKTFKRFLKLFFKEFDIDWDTNEGQKDEDEISDEIFGHVDAVLKIIQQIHNESSKACIFVLSNLENAMPKANREGIDPDILDKTLWDHMWEDIFQKLIPYSYLFIDSTRHAKFARYANSAKLIDIDPLDDDAALQLLKEVAGTIQPEVDDVVAAIANLCFGLPMAIINAGEQLRGIYKTEELMYLLRRETIKIVSDEFLESDHRIDSNLHASLSRLSKKDRENLVSLAFAIAEKEQHNLDTEMEIGKLTKIYGFETVAEFKMNFVSKFRYNGMMKFMRVTQTISCHPILQKYLLIGKAVEKLRQEFKDKVKRILLDQVECLHKDSLDKRKTTEHQQEKNNSDDEAIVAHPDEEVDKCIRKGQDMIVQDHNAYIGNNCYVAQPTEEVGTSHPDNLEFFKKETNRPQTCLPAYSKSDDKLLEGKATIAQPVDECNKSGDCVTGFFPHEIYTPATCLPAYPKEPNSDGLDSDMKEKCNVANYRGASKEIGNINHCAGDSAITKNLKSNLKTKYLHSKSLSDSEIEVNGNGICSNFQNDLSKSENQMNIIADMESLEENDKISSSYSQHVNQRVATVHPYQRAGDIIREKHYMSSKESSGGKTGNDDNEATDETQVKPICNSDNERKKHSSYQGGHLSYQTNANENFRKPSEDSEHLNFAVSGLDPNSLFSDTTEKANPEEQTLQSQTTEESLEPNSSQIVAVAKGAINWLLNPFTKPRKPNGDVQDI